MSLLPLAWACVWLCCTIHRGGCLHQAMFIDPIWRHLIRHAVDDLIPVRIDTTFVDHAHFITFPPDRWHTHWVTLGTLFLTLHELLCWLPALPAPQNIDDVVNLHKWCCNDIVFFLQDDFFKSQPCSVNLISSFFNYETLSFGGQAHNYWH